MAAAGGGPGGGGPEYSDHLAGTEPAWRRRGSRGRKEREEKQASEHLAPYTPESPRFSHPPGLPVAPQGVKFFAEGAEP